MHINSTRDFAIGEWPYTVPGLADGGCTYAVPGTLPLENAHPQYQGLCHWRMRIYSTRGFAVGGYASASTVPGALLLEEADFVVGGCASMAPGTPELFLTNTTLTFLLWPQFSL